MGIALLLAAVFLGTKLISGYDVGLPDKDAPTTIIQVADREVMVTDDVRHSVPLDEIIGGGPPKDGIPPIDNPKFLSVSAASKEFDADDPGLMLVLDGTARFYPNRVLVWHEIVNDTINNKRVLVTYCPLCATGIVFDPVVNGERVEFGTSGRLWQSNLLMYDRATDSLWSQILGEAVVGSATGMRLPIIPSDITTFGSFAAAHATGDVLSKDTGAFRDYSRDPYSGYYTNNNAINFPLRNKDSRLQTKDYILGVVIDGAAKAYSADAIEKAGVYEDTFAGRNIIARWNSDLESAQLFERLADGSEVRLEGVVPGFWFSWVAAYPETELWNE